MKRFKSSKSMLLMAALIIALMLGTGSVKADFTFNEPVNLSSIIPVIDPAHDAVDCLSCDGLEMYIDSNRSGGYGEYDLYVLKRDSKDAEWGSPENLGSAVNSTNNDGVGCLSADGLTLYFNSDRPDGYGEHDIWMTTRTSKDDPWGTAVNLGPNVNGADDDACPWISSDGLRLYFESWRPEGFGKGDIWVSTRETTMEPWGEPVNLGDTVNTSYSDGAPSISSDERTLYFSSDRTGGRGKTDLYVTKRLSPSDPWGEPVNLGVLVNSLQEDAYPRLAPDGCELYFWTDRSGAWENCIASPVPICDFNGDGLVDSDDMRIMIDHWGENCSLCDIGPTPLGDGMVDVQDLIVLSEHLFIDVRIFVDDDATDDPGPDDPLISDPLEDGSAEHPFDSIQEAIDTASEMDCVVLLPGTYTGDGNRNLTFNGKAITIRSLDSDDSQVVAATVIDCQGSEDDQQRGFVFSKGESARSVVAGLTITNAYGYYGGGINCYGNSSPTISKCVFKNNAAVKGGGGLCKQSGKPTIANCLFIGNTAESGGALYNFTDAGVVNCTFVNNSATVGGAVFNRGGVFALTNCILWNNGPEPIHVDDGDVLAIYSNIQGGWEGEGNIDTDPLFADPDNDDYHLKSQIGRWDPLSATWAQDAITSPCIDAGDPTIFIGDETEPNGGQINMGAYGGTVEASMSP